MEESAGLHRAFDNSAVELTGKVMVVGIIVLFLVVIFVLFLHLYAKWFWWRTEDGTVPSRETRRARRRFVFVPGQDSEVTTLRTGLDHSVLRSLPIILFKVDDFRDGLECAVCLCELVNGDKARLLPKCKHGFHVDCVDMWFQSHSTCPLCRNPVTESSVSNTAIDEQNLQLAEENGGNGSNAGNLYGTNSCRNFPTNVLFWGNNIQVTSCGACLEEGPSSSNGSEPDAAMAIEIQRQVSANRFTGEEEMKSPMATRLRSLKRLLNKEKKVAPCTPSCADLEQGG